jgi:hypothetical protein
MRPKGLLLLFLLVACGKQQPTETAPPKVSAAPSASEAPPAPAPPPPPAETASAAPPAASSSAPVAEEPAPKVKVFSIGMHVANGPFDEETKKPYLKAVEPHYPELAKCWNKVNDKTKGGDVGVDLLIGPTGGKPKVSHPRTTVEGAGEAFMPCVVAFFETIEFGKPHSGGLQGVSYSVRFKPTK